MATISAPFTIVDMVASSPPLLEAVEASFEPSSDLFNSPATPAGLRTLRRALRNGRLSDATQKRIALAIGNFDGRAYRNISLLRRAQGPVGFSRQSDTPPSDSKAQAAVGLAVRIAACDGCLEEADLVRIKQAGFCAAELLEIVGHVALNNLTNYINHLFATENHFPVAQTARAA